MVPRLVNCGLKFCDLVLKEIGSSRRISIFHFFSCNSRRFQQSLASFYNQGWAYNYCLNIFCQHKFCQLHKCMFPFFEILNCLYRLKIIRVDTQYWSGGESICTAILWHSITLRCIFSVCLLDNSLSMLYHNSTLRYTYVAISKCFVTLAQATL